MSEILGVHGRWLSEIIGVVRGEPRSKCHACSMCSSGDPMSRNVLRFKPELKCCTYWPVLPNYLVGAALAGEPLDEVAQEGRRRLELFISGDLAVPRGLGVPEPYQLTFNAPSKEFGRDPLLLCPFYSDEDGGVCTIWEHRNAVCSTYFCKVDRGVAGFAFWEALRKSLSAIERAVATWCARELDIPPAGVQQPLPGARDVWATPQVGPAVSTRSTEVWGKWVNKRGDYYAACQQVASGLCWPEVVRLGGSELETLVDVLVRAHTNRQQPQNGLTGHVNTGQIRILGAGSGSVVAVTYRETDPRRLSRKLLNALLDVAGLPIGAAKTLIAQACDTSDDPQAVYQVLVDERYLLETGEAEGS